MKIYINELSRIANKKDYDVNIDYYKVDNNPFVYALKDVEGIISFYYDSQDELRIVYHLVGDMICPDAITLEDIEYPFELKEDDKVVFNENDEGFYLGQSMELEDLVYYIVGPEAPIKVVKNKKIEYSRRDDWVFMSEEDYEASKKDEIDPRLQKLKDYKFEEGD